MGTAVLLPRDCLPNSKNRPKGHLSEAIFHSERASRPRSGISKANDARDSSTACFDPTRKNALIGRVGWTPKSPSLPPLEFGLEPLQTEVEGKKHKARKPTELREIKPSVKSTSDVRAFTILQRPKNKKAADELFAKFLVKAEVEKVPNRQIGSKSEFSEAENVKIQHLCHSFVSKTNHQSSTRTKLSEMQMPGSKLKKGGCTIKAEEPKVVDLNLSAPKLADKVEGYKSGEDLDASKGQCGNVALGMAGPINVVRRSSDCNLHGVMHLKGLSQVPSLKVAPEQKTLKEAGSVEIPKSKQLYQSQPLVLESTVPARLPRLKRATTDPQIVKQLVGPCRSEVLDIPFSEANTCNGFTKMASMSCPERWAGPSYFSSPAPSSLPLPKFSASNQKLQSLQSTGEGHIRKIPQLPDVETLVPEESPPQGAALDVAFATKSLRRMLKLDPF